MGYPSETPLKLKAREISLVQNIRYSCLMVKTIGLRRNKLFKKHEFCLDIRFEQ